MKIFNRYVYLLVTKDLLSKEKLAALKQGKAHIGRNPVRKPKGKEAPDGQELR